MTDYVRACALDEVPGQGTFGVELNGTPLVIIRSEGEIYALDEFCTHEDVSLVDGEVYDRTVECWLHGSCFDLRSGKPTGPPATRPITTYPVRIDGGDVYVALPEEERHVHP
ncbi:MAG: non-heme iron oxygenase ferredoxin subunit [Streptosporangiaceae bacterium]